MKKILPWIVCFLWIAGVCHGSEKLFVLQDNCVKCHLWSESTLGENSVVQWKNSVHFRPGSACADCHGGDRLFSMEFKKGHMGVPNPHETVAMCEKCHAQEVRDFVNRPLPQDPEKACTLSCVDCHGHHRVEAAHGGLVNTSACGQCHTPEKAASLMETIGKTEAVFAATEKRISSHQQAGLPTESLTEELGTIQRRYAQSFHKMRLSTMETFLNINIQEALTDLEQKTNVMTPKKLQMRAMVVVGFLALLSLVLGLYLRSLYHTQSKK